MGLLSGLGSVEPGHIAELLEQSRKEAPERLPNLPNVASFFLKVCLKTSLSVFSPMIQGFLSQHQKRVGIDHSQEVLCLSRA